MLVFKHMSAIQRGMIQIAGIHDAAEAELIIEEGVSWIGIPLRLAVHKEDLSLNAAADIVRTLGRYAHFVVITYLHTAEEILALCDQIGTRIVQLHGDIEPDEVERLKQLDPELTCMKSLVVRSGNLPTLQQTARRFSSLVDGFITDTYDPATGACGATGRTHDWSVSRALVQGANKPVILAGGLTPSNVAEAIRFVEPTGVDAHTGVEGADGRKDRSKVRAFVQAACNAFSTLSGPPSCNTPPTK